MEEAYEVVEAVETGGEPNMPLLCEGAGRRCCVVFHSDIAAANPQGFDIVQVVEVWCRSFIRATRMFEAEFEGSSRRPAPRLNSRRPGTREEEGEERAVARWMVCPRICRRSWLEDCVEGT